MAAVAALAGLLAGAYWRLRPHARPQVTGMVQLTDDGQSKYGPLLTDGSRVYFGLRTAGMAQVSVRGGEVASALISVPQAFPLDISPDGSEFLVTQFTTSADMAPLWVVPVLAGSPWRVGNLMVNRVGASPSWMPQAAAWSPDMQRIAFAMGNELYVAQPD